MASTTIRYSGLPGNRQSGANSNRRPGVPSYLEQVVYAAAADEHPHDPLDPGPYGSPGWHADKRTGRHRRGELPDPPSEKKPSASGYRRSRFWPEADDGQRYYFGKLREDAWTDFLIDSDELFQAHHTPTVTAFERWVRMWESLWAFLLRVLGVRIVAKTTPRSASAPVVATPAQATPEPVPPIKVEWRSAERSIRGRQPAAAIGVAKVRRPSPLAGIPSQGQHRTSPVKPFMAQWERHFDAAQAFREAVAL
jgi:hypothetical protein